MVSQTRANRHIRHLALALQVSRTFCRIRRHRIGGMPFSARAALTRRHIRMPISHSTGNGNSMIPADSPDDSGNIWAAMKSARNRNLLDVEQTILIRAEISFAKC
jgi:hypothetical protein